MTIYLFDRPNPLLIPKPFTKYCIYGTTKDGVIELLKEENRFIASISSEDNFEILCNNLGTLFKGLAGNKSTDAKDIYPNLGDRLIYAVINCTEFTDKLSPTYDISKACINYAWLNYGQNYALI